MDSSQQIIMEFEMHANKLFVHLYNQFESSTGQLNRSKDENVFQQSAARFTIAFKQQLEAIAIKLLEQHQHSAENVAGLRQYLTKRIEICVNEFKQKAKDV